MLGVGYYLVESKMKTFVVVLAIAAYAYGKSYITFANIKPLIYVYIYLLLN